MVVWLEYQSVAELALKLVELKVLRRVDSMEQMKVGALVDALVVLMVALMGKKKAERMETRMVV